MVASVPKNGLEDLQTW